MTASPITGGAFFMPGLFYSCIQRLYRTGQ
nr:MAG TPA: hypothetical protein [Caudoviricetes sp.]